MIRINLLPWREARRKARNLQFYILMGMVAGLAASIVLLVHGYYATRISTQTERNRFLKDENAKLDKEIEEIKKLKEEIQALLSRKQVIETLQADRAQTVYLLEQLVRQTPDGVYLRSVKQAGNKVISIIGARNQDLLFWEDRMRAVSDELTVCTDDGSYARKALVTEPLKEALEREKVDRVWAIGPAIMMKYASLAATAYDVPCIVSLNTVMIDGTGMCGGCRVLLDDGARFVCVDGPEFDGHQVDFDQMMKRMSAYKALEQKAHQAYQDHRCRIGLGSTTQPHSR